MPTSDFRRFLLSTRQACASLVTSGLVLGLAMATAGATPAPDTPSGRTGSVVGTAVQSLDPTFVQEGTPSTNGGQIVRWGDLSGTNSPPALPSGVLATAVTSDSSRILVLRSDGQVDSHYFDSSSVVTHHVPAPPNMKYTAVSPDGGVGARVLRSDGVVVDLHGRVVKTPPEGLAYTAITPRLVLRSDGVLRPSGTPTMACPDASDPGPGLRYTAVSAGDSYSRWVALRSDGAFVYCVAENGETLPTVFEPPAGTRFIGVDMGQAEAVAATADGRIISSENGTVAVAPTGRSIVSLAAIRYGQGAAALDDGTILSWGLTSDDASPPLVPAERAVFSAVTGQGSYGQHWAIMVGDPVPVGISVEPMLPSDRPLRVTDAVRVDVTAALTDGTPITGLAGTTVRAPDGQERTLETKKLWPDSATVTLMPRDHAQIGSHNVAVTFSGSPYTTTTIENTLDFAEPSPVALTTSGPTTWRQGSYDTLCFRVATADGSPLWWDANDSATISVDGDPGQSYDFYLPHQDGRLITACMRDLEFELEPGTYTGRFTYDGWGEADSASWSGEVVVVAMPATHVESDLPSSWHYGQMPDSIGVDVRSDSLVPTGDARLYLDDRTPFAFGYAAQLDGTGHGWIRTGDEDELVPGTYPMVLRFKADGGFLDSHLERTVTVKPAPFTTATPTITGTAKVGSTLTAAPGTWSPTPTSYRYLWKVDGVAVTGATSSTFTVPTSAGGKRITVTVTGLKQYYESSATSAPTTATGTFTAPQPAIKGTAQVGRTLTVTRGTWSPSPSSVEYVWKANGVTISTQTSSTFVVPASAMGKRLTVTVIGARAGYTTRSVTSPATSIVAAGTFTAPRPTISGTMRVGSTLTVSRGTWTPVPSSVTYVWKADGVTIATRTSSRFVVPERVRGKQLTVTVTGILAGYTPKSAASYRTTTIS